MDDCRKQVTYDDEINNLIKIRLTDMELYPNNRYYVIRETTSTKRIVFKLKKDLVESFRWQSEHTEQNRSEFDCFQELLPNVLCH